MSIEEVHQEFKKKLQENIENIKNTQGEQEDYDIEEKILKEVKERLTKEFSEKKDVIEKALKFKEELDNRKDYITNILHTIYIKDRELWTDKDRQFFKEGNLQYKLLFKREYDPNIKVTFEEVLKVTVESMVNDELEKNKEEQIKKQLQILDINKIKEYEHNPFKAYNDEKLEELANSINESGLLHQLILLKNNDEYTVLSGHNRLKALKLLGYEKLNSNMYRVYEGLSQDEINLIVVNTNLQQRQKLLYSEKAFAYKMQMEAIKCQGKRTDLTSPQVVEKLNNNKLVANKNNESGEQVRRYIRLTYLIPYLLDMVDDKKIKFTTGVTLSYLREQEQEILFKDYIKIGRSISLEQAEELKKQSLNNNFNSATIELILKGEIKKPKNIKIKMDKIKSYFKEDVTQEEIEQKIIYLLEKEKDKEAYQ